MSAEARAAAWADAALAAELFAVAPRALGGLVLRGGPGPARDLLCSWLRAALPPGAPLQKLPLHVTEDRLLGGLALAATLRAGRIVAERGVLAAADGGAVQVAMAERLSTQVTAHLCAALDAGELQLARVGLSAAVPCSIGVVALDEGLDDERAPAALRDRLALHVQLDALGPRAAGEGDAAPQAERMQRGRALWPRVEAGPAVVEALCAASLALGIDSLRAPLLALNVARAHAALEGRTTVEEEDAALAARLVLGPRATRLPPASPDEDPPPPEDEDDDEDEAEEGATPGQPEPPPPAADAIDAGEAPSPQAQQQPEDSSGEEREASAQATAELLLEAARSGIPAGLLDTLMPGRIARAAPKSAGRAGALRASSQDGRPAGVRPGMPRGGERLNLVETLRAAAPWQPLRRRERAAREAERAASGAAPVPRLSRVEVRPEDFRVYRFQQRAETSVIFAVDASGSAALQRLAEAKGAVEQVLADCYVRRDHVALVAFRGTTAPLVVAPTRSLVRARRSLAGLAGGGSTPLATGIDAALALAGEARRRGQTPVLVLMTDGRGNIARDGRADRAAAEADALSAARAVRALGVAALFLDTSPRPRPPARLLAQEMGARYMPLPYTDAEGISRAAQSLAGGTSR